MKSFLFLLAITCFLFSCKNQPAGNTLSSDGKDSVAARVADSLITRRNDSIAKEPFFPVADYVGGQLRYVDSFKFPITKSITINGKINRAVVSDAEFRSLAAHFQQPDINDTAIKKYYTETSIADQSTASATLSYTTSRPGLEIRKVDVIIQPDPVKSDRVKTIYMEKNFQVLDTIVNQKLYWRNNHNFQIITEKQVGKNTLPVEQLKVVWDPSE